MEERKRCYIDAARYHERVSDASASQEDIRKADEKMAELTQRTNELVATISDAIKRRSALIESIVAETIEFQRRFYVDSARCMERAIDAIGADKLGAMRGGADEPPERRTSVNVPPAQPEPSQSTPQPPPRRTASVPMHSNSIWNELDDDDDDDDDDNDIYNQQRPKSSAYTDNIFDDPLPSQPEPESSRRSEPGSASDSSTGVANPFGRERTSNSYPSNGLGKRESAYPSGGVGQKESVSSYPTGGSRTRDKYPNSRTRAAAKPPPGPTSSFAPSSSRESNSDKPKPTRPVEPEADLLGFDTPTPPKPMRSRRSPSPPSSTNTEDLLDLGGIPDTSSSQRSSMRRSASSTAVEGDLLGDLGAAPQPRPRSSTQSRARRSAAPQQSFSAPTMSATPMNAAPKPTAKPAPSNTTSKEEELLQREQLRKKHEKEIKARADEKLAAVRERERADAKEREDKDNARSAAERKINAWTGNGTRRGNLRALLASLDTVLYPTATWKAVSMDVLKENSKVKVNYHKAILQVHPDKISSKESLS
ncbi:Chaperone J-domain containing protein [Gracilaria domingensis]|nr:Chaperone J-domain containing protein [Gracilaria domingensis]